VVDQGIAIAAEAFYDPDPRGLASFGFDATLRKDVPVADFEAALEKIVKAALADGLTADEVARAKARMQTAAIYDQDGIMGPARIIGSALASGLTLDDVQHWPDRIGAVTLDEVNAAARLVIHDDVAVTAVLLPQPTS
jgi:zinc protease